ncbi:hypothetical protein A0O34_21440 [Chryseobacterium glaciei]|uniref:Uncharacterized protein n=1 Tax=Chryseobacterium glaciei TaxID=1685010 RepID=A0A172Y1D8_9FLAO|nr:hypothetical protein [Chryseobacterium glaciei]ANF52926.1 hypothetical protein A0O34_21440 [Chryseobacterium glaciei]
MATNFETHDFDNAGQGSISRPDGKGNFENRNGDTRDRADREYGREGRDNSKSAKHENLKNSDINISKGLIKNEGSREINGSKVISSTIGISLSAIGITSIYTSAAEIGAGATVISVGTGIGLTVSAFAIPALILGTVSLVLALSGEQNEDAYDGLEIAGNPLMVSALSASSVYGNNTKTAIQHSKYASTALKSIISLQSPKSYTNMLELSENIFQKMDAIDSIKNTKDDLNKIRMSKLP